MSRPESIIVDYKSFDIKNFVVGVPKSQHAKSDESVVFYTIKLFYKDSGVHKTLVLKSPPLCSNSGIKRKETKRGIQYKMAATLNQENEEHVRYREVLDEIYDAVIDNLLNNAATRQVCGMALQKLSESNPESFMYNLYIKPTDTVTGRHIEGKDPIISDIVKYIEDSKTANIYTAKFTNLLGEEEKWDTLTETGFEAYRYLRFDEVFIGIANLIRKQVIKGVVTKLLERKVDEESIRTREEYIQSNPDAVRAYTEKRQALEKARKEEIEQKKIKLMEEMQKSSSNNSSSPKPPSKTDDNDNQSDPPTGGHDNSEDDTQTKSDNETLGTLPKVSGFSRRRKVN